MDLHEALSRFPGYRVDASFYGPEQPRADAEKFRRAALMCEAKAVGLPAGSEWGLDAMAYRVIADHLDPPSVSFKA